MIIQTKSNKAEWEGIINEIDKTCINTRIVDSVEFINADAPSTDVNLNNLRNAGISEDEIDFLIHDAIDSLANTDSLIDVKFDIGLIIKTVSPITRNYLKMIG